MRTITKTVYQYNELSEDAKARARDWYRGAGFEYAWSEEWRDTLERFQEEFPIRVTEWEVSTWRPSYVSADICPGEDFDAEDMKGARAWKWLMAHGYDKIRSGQGTLVPVIGEEYGACSLTGYCGDADILEPLALFLRRPGPAMSLHDVFTDCLHAWVKAWQADMEYQETDEYAAEAIEINEYEFTEEGDRA